MNYGPLDSIEKLTEEETGLMTESPIRKITKTSKTLLILTSLVATFFATLSLILGFVLLRQSHWSQLGSYERGFETDLHAISGFDVPLVKTVFNHGVMFDVNGTMHPEAELAGMSYVGKPNPQVDKNWYGLLTGLNIDIPGDQAKDIQNVCRFSTPYIAWLREALHPEYYRRHAPPGHLDHCIEHLRQALQCHSDLTPMNWQIHEDGGIHLRQDGVHTCRDFSKVHEWAKNRDSTFLSRKDIIEKTIFVTD